MYHTELNPLKKITRQSESVKTPRSGQQRKLHKAFLRYHDSENWDILRQGLKAMGRSDLIGNGEDCLVPYSSMSDKSKYQHSSKGKRNNDFHHRISVKKSRKR